MVLHLPVFHAVLVQVLEMPPSYWARRPLRKRLDAGPVAWDEMSARSK